MPDLLERRAAELRHGHGHLRPLRVRLRLQLRRFGLPGDGAGADAAAAGRAGADAAADRRRDRRRGRHRYGRELLGSARKSRFYCLFGRADPYFHTGSKNKHCEDGEFCNAEADECFVCYYPGDLDPFSTACDRYENACGYTCNGEGEVAGGGGGGSGVFAFIEKLTCPSSNTTLQWWRASTRTRASTRSGRPSTRRPTRRLINNSSYPPNHQAHLPSRRAIRHSHKNSGGL